MRNQIICSIALIFCFSTFIFAQSKSAYFNKIEEAIEQDNLNLKIRQQYYHRERDSFKYTLWLNLNARYAGYIQMERPENLKNFQTDFKYSVENINKTKVGEISRAEFINIGDEAYIWKNIKGATLIKFRKGDVFVNIYTIAEEMSGTPSEELAKILAQYVVKDLP